MAKIREQADGNPFYLEELARAARERSEVIPDTLIAMVQARLDKLFSCAKRRTRCSPVVGDLLGDRGVGEPEETCHVLPRRRGPRPLRDADRVLGHDLAAQWLERMGERDESIITGHRHRGGRLESA